MEINDNRGQSKNRKQKENKQARQLNKIRQLHATIEKSKTTANEQLNIIQDLKKLNGRQEKKYRNPNAK